MLLGEGLFPVYNITATVGSRRSSRCSGLNIQVHSKGANTVIWRRPPLSKASLPMMSLAPVELKEPSFEPRLADQLCLGGLSEDGLSYIEKFKVRSYEVGIDKIATIQTITNYLQEVICNHALSLGCPLDGFYTLHCMREKPLIWVTPGQHIEVYKYPAWNDIVEIETWSQIEGRINITRCSVLKDYATSEVIGRARSEWLVIDQKTRRPWKFVGDILDEVLKHSPKYPRSAFPEANKSCLKKIEKLDYDSAQYSKLGLMTRQGDLDINQHVNNATYVGWVLESLPEEIVCSHEIQSLTLEYKRECHHNDEIDSITSPESILTNELAALEYYQGFGSNTPCARDENGFLQFRHSLRLSGVGCEVCRGKTVWRKKPTTMN